MLRTLNGKKTVFKLLLAALLITLFAILIGMGTKTSAATAWTALKDTDGTALKTGEITKNTTVNISGEVTLSEEVIVPSGKTLTINATGACTIKRSTANATHYMFTCRPGGTMKFVGGSGKTITIDGNQDGTVNGTYSLIAAQGTVTLNYVILKNNYVSNSTPSRGGAITVWHYNNGTAATGKSLVLNNCEITNCVAKKGGGIFLENSGSGTVTISNTKIHDCKATANAGGALYANSNSNYDVVLSDNNAFYENTANVGGAIAWATSNANASLDIQGGSYYNNTIETHAEGTASLYTRGGAIYINSGSNVTAKISGSGVKIYGNTATLGGAIFIMGGGLEISNGSIYKNEARPLGGAIYIKSGTLTISGGQIHSNDTGSEKATNSTDTNKYVGRDYTQWGGMASEAIETGGAIFMYDGKIVMTGGTIGADATGSSNSAYYGAGIYMYGGTMEASGGKISYNDGSYSNQNNIFMGGGIYVNNGTLTLSGSVEITHNGNYDKTWSGGGVYVNLGTMTMSDNVKIDNNTASNSGGGVYVVGTADTKNFKMSGGSISNNTMKGSHRGTGQKPFENVWASYGGGVYVQEGDFEMTGGTISGNQAWLWGGGIEIRNGNFYMSGGTISNNKLTSQKDKHTVTVDDKEVVLLPVQAAGGGIFMANNGATFEMTGGTISGNEVNGVGGGIWIRYNGTITIDGGTISGNKAYECDFDMKDSDEAGTYDKEGCGGGIYMSNGTVTFKSGKIYGNTSEQDGAGVYIYKGNFSMSGGTIGGSDGANTASQYGGGVYLYSGKVTLSGTAKIDSNKSNSYGGGVYLYDGTFTMENGAISNNTAKTYGGGVYIYIGDFTMSGGTIASNGGVSNGGAVYVTAGNFSMSGSAIIENNSATNEGGGIYVRGELDSVQTGGIITMSGSSKIRNNSATGYQRSASNTTAGWASYGGGVYLYKGTFTMSEDAEITGNQAWLWGGGVEVNAGDFIMLGGTISENVIGPRSGEAALGATNTSSIALSSQRGGGAIMIVVGKFQMDGGTISGHSIAGRGGAILLRDSGCTFIMNGGTISENTATSRTDVSDFTSGYGGAIYVLSSGASVTIAGGSIESNSAELDGGAVYIAEGTVTMSAGTLTSNTASGDGGAVYLASGTFSMSSGTISSNEAQNGGGIYINSSDASKGFTMSGGLITSNSSVDGAGAYIANGTFQMLDGDINSNNASGNGGGVYVKGNFSMEGGKIGGGTASAAKNGGGVYVKDGSFTLSGEGKIIQNAATNHGGGVYFDGGSNEFNILSGGSITENTAGNYGGGAYVLSGTVKLDGGSITGNSSTAEGSTGGGVRVEDGTFNFISGSISNNSTDDKGGGIYIEKGDFIMTTGTVSGNKTKAELTSGGGNGGAIYVRRGNFTMYDGEISGNTSAKNGGAVYVWTHASVDDAKTVITIQNSEIKISGGTVKNNTANQGGAFYIHGGDLTVTGGSFTNNTASNGGGAIYIYEDRYYLSQDYGNGAFITKVNIESGSFTGNVTSAGQGGAIYICLVKGSRAEVVIGLEGCDGADNSSHVHPVFQGNVAQSESCGGIYISKDTEEYTPSANDTFLHEIYTESDLSKKFESYVSLSIYCGTINGNDGNLKEDVNLQIENGVVVLTGAADLGNEGIILSGGELTLNGFDYSDENFKGIMVTGGTLMVSGKDNVDLTLIIDWDEDGTADQTEKASVPVDFPLRLPSYDKGSLTTIAWYTDNKNDYDMVETTFRLTANTVYTAIVNYWGHGIELDPLIGSGKQYNDFTSESNTVFSNDSAFTVEFAIHYMEASKFFTRELSLSEQLPEGTTILLIDKTYKNTPKYYYYVLSGTETVIDLESFKALGTKTDYPILQPTYDQISGEENYVSETLTFIIDLADDTELTGDLTVSLTRYVNSISPLDTEVETAANAVQSQTVTLAAKRTFTLTESDSTVSYTTEATANAGDSRYDGKSFSIVVSAKNGTLPSDMSLTVEGNSYTLNKNGYFIIPLENATSASLNMTAQSLSANGLGLALKAELYASDNGAAPLMGECVATVDVAYAAVALPTFTIDEATSDRTMASDGSLTVNFTKTNVTGTVTVEIQKKSGNTYSKVDKTAPTIGENSFTVTSENLNITLESGYETYRALIKVKDSSGNTVFEIPYNFIVIIG